MIDKVKKRYSKRNGNITVRAYLDCGNVIIQQVEKFVSYGKVQYTDDKISIPIAELDTIYKLMVGLNASRVNGGGI